MNGNISEFQKELYLTTGGFLASQPLTQVLNTGDFFQIGNGKVLRLGNIKDLGLNITEVEAPAPNGYSKVVGIRDLLKLEKEKLKNVKAENLGKILELKSIKHNPENWRIQSGISMRKSGEFETLLTRIIFANKGSFIFSAGDPSSKWISNWSEVQDVLIRAFAQRQFTFREIYVATEVVKVDAFGLVLAQESEASLLMSVDDESRDTFNTIADPESNFRENHYSMVQRGGTESAHFFKAKKMTLKQLPKEILRKRLIQTISPGDLPDPTWTDEDLQNMIRIEDWATLSVDGNVDSISHDALDYFQWTDVSLDDLAKLY